MLAASHRRQSGGHDHHRHGVHPRDTRRAAAGRDRAWPEAGRCAAHDRSRADHQPRSEGNGPGGGRIAAPLASNSHSHVAKTRSHSPISRRVARFPVLHISCDNNFLLSLHRIERKSFFTWERGEMRKGIALLAIFVMLTGVIALADTESKLRNSELTPAADGYVKAGHDRNGNTSYHISVHHLATPTELTPAKSNYVVWIQRPGQAPE